MDSRWHQHHVTVDITDSKTLLALQHPHRHIDVYGIKQAMLSTYAMISLGAAALTLIVTTSGFSPNRATATSALSHKHSIQG